jgi:hypothetical protein
MSDPYVYRSRDPQVVGAWKDACAAIEAYVKATGAVLDGAGLGAYKVYRNTRGLRPGHFAGLAIPQDEFPPEGWRMRAEYAVPDKRTKAGKAVDAALDAVKHPGDPLYRLIGMPPDILTGAGNFSTPAVRLLEDGTTLYTAWRTDPAGCRESFMAGKFEIDRSLWEPVKLSEYYAAIEVADARKTEVRA